ncbi:MAG TPA: TRAP transporter small permease [Bacillota bacterium]|jgi:C4-dicarboxylate transporter DctQ subunit|nr:TRAP transporter small permease [Clostridia bacterium]HOH89873.1 TRAP transporter small permease [Bacillota bacterium]HQL37078.1 TRAP transporter small permease [Bacillota bacterium]
MSESNVRSKKESGNPIIWVWENIEISICLISMVLMTVFTFSNVVLRYIFGSSIAWAEEVSSFLIIWLTYGGSAYAFRMGAHIGIEALVDKLPPKAKHIVRIANNILTIAFFVLLAYYSWNYMTQQIANNQLTPVTRVSVAYPISAVPIGSALVIARVIYQTIQEIKLGVREV